MQNIDNTRERIYKKGEILFKEAEKGEELYIIQSGQVRVYRVVKSKTLEIGTFSKGSVIGEMSLFDNSLRSATAEAATDCRVVYVDKENFTQQLEKVPAWLASIVKIMTKRLRDTSRRVQDAELKDLSGNVAHLLMYINAKHARRSAGVEAVSMQMANKEITEIMGIELEALSKFYEILSRKNIIKIDGGNILIPKPELLELFAQYKQGMLGEAGQSKLSEDAKKLLTTIMGHAEKQGMPCPEGVQFDLNRFHADVEKMTGVEVSEKALQELVAAQLVKIEVRGKAGSSSEQQRMVVDKQKMKKILELEKVMELFEKD